MRRARVNTDRHRSRWSTGRVVPFKARERVGHKIDVSVVGTLGAVFFAAELAAAVPMRMLADVTTVIPENPVAIEIVELSHPPA